MAKKLTKAVYNGRYYKIKALLENKDFQADIAWLKAQFEKYGVPVPAHGFDTYKEYETWNDMFWNVFSERDSSPEVHALWNSIAAEDGKIYGSENMHRYEEQKAELVPPVYGQYLREVAHEHGFDFNDKAVHDFIISHVFFGKDEIIDPSFKLVHKRNPKTEKMELFIQVLPWTTRDDITDNWSFVKEEQARYPEYDPRNQSWKNFDRDYQIYQFYEEARRRKADGDKRRLEEITYSLYYTATKDNDMDLDNIKRIVHYVRKRLGIGDTLSDDNG